MRGQWSVVSNCCFRFAHTCKVSFVTKQADETFHVCTKRFMQSSQARNVERNLFRSSRPLERNKFRSTLASRTASETKQQGLKRNSTQMTRFVHTCKVRV